MPSGGARNRSGPPKDPNSLRSAAVDWTVLPAEGRGDVEPPSWPMAKQSERELELWARFWARPQAVLWESHGLEYEVALHVRSLVEAEKPEAATPLRTLCRQQADALYLTMPAMLAAHIRIAPPRPTAVPDAPAEASEPAGAAAIRSRLAAVPDSVGA